MPLFPKEKIQEMMNRFKQKEFTTSLTHNKHNIRLADIS
jgi:hypothetical protein